MDIYDGSLAAGFGLLVIGVGVQWGVPAALMIGGVLLMGFGLLGAQLEARADAGKVVSEQSEDER